jgi:hypothetical protein
MRHTDPVHRSLLPAFLAGVALALLSLPVDAQDRPLLPRPGHHPGNVLKPGDPAPDFTLKILGGKDETVTLSSFKGRKPVLLAFGSYT